ncbi:MAG: hypothetical protein ACTTJ4_02640 [Treponema sp.]|uniref:hypothetical protein n=1 Tax=Treponema sp. TaxID=166 RepID=UPI003FA32F5E
MKRIVCGALAACVFVAALFGQSAQRIDEILDTNAATFGQAAYLILTSLDAISDDTDFQTAFAEMCQFAEQQGFKKGSIHSSATEAKSIAMKEYAFLLMQAFKVRGGAMYRMYPCPRYAYRDLRYFGVIQEDIDPDSVLSGRMMLQLLGQIDTVQGGAK